MRRRVSRAVVHVMGWPSQQYGSFERFLVMLAARCAQRGARTHLVFPEPPVSDAFLRDVAGEVHVIPSPSHPADPRFAVRVARLMRDVGGTHLHAHFGIDAYHALAVAQGARRFATKHITPGSSRRTLARTRHRWLAARVERLFAVSSAVAERLLTLGVPRGKVEVCHLGVDLAAYRPQLRARAEVRRELSLPEEAPIVLSASHLRPGKGAEVLPDLAAELGGHGGDDVTVLVAGGGPLAPDLQRAALGGGVPPGHLRLLGVREDIPRLLAAADVFVFPSTGVEGLPLGPLEALASGIPVVAAAVSDFPQLLAGAALLVPPGDPVALIGACRRLLRDAKLREELSRRGRALVRERLSVVAAADLHVARYFD
jgi:glycosyltransferase involved in cell wall biosynthesis